MRGHLPYFGKSMLELLHLHWTGWNDSLSQAVRPTVSRENYPERIPRVFQLNDEGTHNARFHV
jgi:hypothetical protein